MKRKTLFYLLVFWSCFSYGQLSCPEITSPMSGGTNVPVDATISWNGVIGAPGYLISIGTTPNGTEIINNQNVGDATSFKPPLGLPDNDDIYVTITIFFFDQANIICDTQMFSTEDVVLPPGCATPRFPINGSENVNVATAISWEYTPTATAYRLSLGTSPGGTDLLDNENIVDALSYKPTFDLPFETPIYVTIIPFNDNGAVPSICPQYSFTTGALATIPGCASLINPIDGAINVELSPVLEWTEIPDATGYRVTIGTTPFNSNVLDNVIFTENKTLVLNFEPNLSFFITIIPFNAAGDALNCEQRSFSTILGCGPYFDSISNEFVDLRPAINFPDTISFCKNESPIMVSSDDTADGFRWYKIDQFDNEELISSEQEIEISEAGMYRYEIYTNISQSGNTIECETSKVFQVISSEIASINALNVTNQNGTIDVSVDVSGIGDYEFSVDNIDGPYQVSNIFNNLEPGIHTFYVRDSNGCGIAEKRLEQDLTVDGFPKFFTPNGDGINDVWQFIQPLGSPTIEIGKIYIFNRYGMLITQIDPTTRGWNGSFNGQPLPASDYWFQTTSQNKVIRGHFTLKR
ncbi:T9SS type B sorting domain-containing protein [Maribacter sp. 2308TA10-17]|uniref:T9SS type B sorting domain-containing protein n=1 Tax=Maribacter sp. 2308TA10-17 TaxID=3386276 RepID=UPI0039BC9858